MYRGVYEAASKDRGRFIAVRLREGESIYRIFLTFKAKRLFVILICNGDLQLEEFMQQVYTFLEIIN